MIMDNMIERKLLNDIIDYCKLNGIEVDTYVNQKLRSALMIDKYGSSPFDKCSGTKVENVVKPKQKLEKNDIPFVVTEQEKIDWESKVGELKPLEPMKPDDDYIKEKTQKKQVKKAAKSDKSDGGKIIVNKRILK